MDENFIKNIFQTVLAESVQVKVIRDRNSGYVFPLRTLPRYSIGVAVAFPCPLAALPVFGVLLTCGASPHLQTIAQL